MLVSHGMNTDACLSQNHILTPQGCVLNDGKGIYRASAVEFWETNLHFSNIKLGMAPRIKSRLSSSTMQLGPSHAHSSATRDFSISRSDDPDPRDKHECQTDMRPSWHPIRS